VTAEIDYLLGQRFGSAARRAFLEDLAALRYESPGLDARDYQAALELDGRYADLRLGMADLSIAVLARKLERAECSRSNSVISVRSAPSKVAPSHCSLTIGERAP
jgi:predicted nucleic acid-binding protein